MFNSKQLPTTAAMFNSCPNTQLSGGVAPVSLEVKQHQEPYGMDM